MDRYFGGVEVRVFDFVGKGREFSRGKYMDIREGDFNFVFREYLVYFWVSLVRELG